MDTAVVRGVELALHPPGDYVSDVIRDTGDFYEADVLDEVAHRITGGVVVDAGAMIGNHTAYIAQFIPTARILAFEPVAANTELLRANVAPYANVKVHEIALSDHRGMERITVDTANFGHSALGGDGPLVNVRTLDSYALHHVRLLKIDVEGHESQVLAGAHKTIERSRPLIVIEDWSGPPAIPGYQVVAEWERGHQTFMLAPA